MLFLPSERIAARLRSEPGGVWIDSSANFVESWLVAKVQTYLIRAIDLGVEVAFTAWVIESDGNYFAAFGLLVYDDAVYPKVVYGACSTVEEIDHLRQLLRIATVPIQFYNENELPLLNATCAFEPGKAVSLVKALPMGAYPVGDGVVLRRKALDILQASMAQGAEPEPRIMAACQLPLEFTRKERLKATVVGVGEFNIEIADQGKELEQLTLHLFDALFKFGAYHSPQRDHSDGRREVCDVLAVSRVLQFEEEGIFVVQNKVAFTDRTQRTLDRRGRTIQTHILNGLGQVVGAIKKLKSGIQVFRSDGGRIEDDPSEIAEFVEPLDLHKRAQQAGYGIVLISDLHEGVDWKMVWTKLLDASRETGYFFHVLDLQELHNLVVNSNGQPAILESHLIQRWERMTQHGHALVRFRFIV